MRWTSVIGRPGRSGTHGAAWLAAALAAAPSAAASELYPPGGPALAWLWLLLPLAIALFLLLRRDPPAAADDGEAADPDAVDRDFAFYERTFRHMVSSLPHQGESERSYVEMISAMVATAHARDHETLGHSFRVARYAVALARRMGLEGDTLTAVEWGALLHDVGKIAVPEAVLRKRGPLNEAEMAVMREHPRRGYQMLKGLLFLGTGLDVVLSHHERWDGRGYPNGLAGQNIPLSARIFAVVDTYDAITSDRPYRAARGHREAADELRRVAGSQLDPEVVARFLEISEEELRALQDLSRSEEVGAGSARHPEVLRRAGGAAPLARLRVGTG